ncbi:hypothetical protein ANHYDRO_00190 [Anaerococcus hydrogenalis DSM 7454]|uniref:Uncharacterized protein n=1 Tax=Anaerococcus hydrogenalis DSM 7454 TaxID=561177 RepID=B6W6L0_9FIRM|nr:hypothetical protein [Anaerococcus hydrogenalis]EEB36953.1 hypothetical protein ANHYDRO_00190 [Anaerococcus hydrogenalis DSM 7454]
MKIFLKKKKQNLSTLSNIKNDLVSLKDSEKKLNKLIYDYDIDQKTRLILKERRDKNNKEIKEKISDFEKELTDIKKIYLFLKKKKILYQKKLMIQMKTLIK